ncbi:cation diffusion facilitator family transporter [Lishizhenia sp.]|uniref:cation diffusion facilitator family transporter n=1 Tax=Lishizhenia sp. TaxID=2497594 RepID=UPI00299DE974|nr:cation diffusion facilitator family transporter [Lishizhenia sp.]MDX1445126.1 cation diffusion facilitator family transporter [Lishizhenia sp.]
MAEHHHHHKSGDNLKLAFFLNLSFTFLEFIGGWWVNSVAIYSDAIHDLGDSLALGTAWYLDKKSKQDPNKKYTFGYQRFSLLGALINSIVLIVGSIWVVKEAIERIAQPEASNASGMLVFALVGITVNGYAAWKVGHGKSLNERVVSWHLLEDVLGWVAILVLAIILQFTDAYYLDPILSLFITLFILWGVFKRLKETLYIFLQGAPQEIDLDNLKLSLLNIDKVEEIHHTHIWTIEGDTSVFTTHIKLKEIDDYQEIIATKEKIKNHLKTYNFKHCTLEIELDKEKCSLD